MALFVSAAFAADGTVPTRVIPTGTGASGADTSTSQSSSARGGSRTATPSGTRVASRGISTITKSETDTDTKSSGSSVVSRGATTTSARGGETANVRGQTDINSNPAVRRAGLVLRPSFAEYGGRAIIAGTDQQTGSNIDVDIRKVTGRATAKKATKESIAEAKDVLEQTAELNKSCQQQYNECMDQFCSVIDSNQKRCSCSANLSKYSKVEEAVNAANTKLNEVAQNIRYIGLSADEIRAIMTATEAEDALSGTKDNTENRNLLEQIEQMIKDPKSATASYTSGDFGIDMDLDFSSETDLFSLDFLNTNTASSLSNLRGAELYNAAKNRCNTVLNQCKKAGATTQQVSGNYDLAIDKDCIAYEAGLKKMNETLVSNVHSAERMLQKARLAVLQNKNQYDIKGCIGALEACMTDDMVCGDDYAKCVDPTKVYIDENGNVVLGKDISSIIKFMDNYDNTKIDNKFLESAYKMPISDSACSKTGDDDTSGGDGSCTVKYLLQKIGTKQKVTDEGLCRAVLDKCQAYTYNNNAYNPYNDVVVNYIQRAMINIRASQYKIISDYASSCMVDVAACYNQQVTQVNAWSSSASTTSIMNVMSGACRNVALTCAYGIFAHTPEMGQSCTNISDTDKCLIERISEMFYQSLVCPENSTYKGGEHTNIAVNGEAGFVNSACECNSGYVAWSGYCVLQCGNNAVRDTTTGRCSCDTGYTGDGYTCTAQTTQGS